MDFFPDRAMEELQEEQKIVKRVLDNGTLKGKAVNENTFFSGIPLWRRKGAQVS